MRATPPVHDCRKKSADEEAALHLTVVYEDAVTRHWAWELWGRVGQLAGQGGIYRESWRFAELAEPEIFADAVKAAAKADVLVIALRETELVPPILRMWVDGWLRRRAGRPGALVALIGVPAQPGAETGGVHRLLEIAARQAELDYLPRERKLPEEPPPRPFCRGRVTRAALPA